MTRELVNKTATPVASLAISARTASADGTAVDLQGYQAATVLVLPGTITNGNHAVKLQESDTTTPGDFTDVVGADLTGGSFPANLTSNTAVKIAYIGTKRYIRAVVTVTGSPATGGIYGVFVQRGYGEITPAP